MSASGSNRHSPRRQSRSGSRHNANPQASPDPVDPQARDDMAVVEQGNPPDDSPDVIIDEARSTPAPIPHIYVPDGQQRLIPPGIETVRDVAYPHPHRRGVVIGHTIELDNNNNEVHRAVALFPGRHFIQNLEVKYAFIEENYGDVHGLVWMHPDNDGLPGNEFTVVNPNTVILNEYFYRLWLDGGIEVVRQYARQMLLVRTGRGRSWELPRHGDWNLGRCLKLEEVLFWQM